MEFEKLVRSRRCIRSFAGTPVDVSLLRDIVDAARYAPSAGNGQPWHFYVVLDPDTHHALYERAYPVEWFRDAPAVIVVCVDYTRAESRYGERGRHLYCLQDTAAAIENMLLCITDKGLASCWIGAFDERQCAHVLSLPENERPVAMLPVGYPQQDAPMPRRAPLEKVVTFIDERQRKRTAAGAIGEEPGAIQ